MIRAVLVTGPQRSGTTITAKILAELLGWAYVDELHFGANGDDAFWRFLRDPTRRDDVVVQCPGMFASIMGNAGLAELVVLCRRPLEEIWLSQDRIGWRGEWEPIEAAILGDVEDSAAEKYAWWDRGPRPPLTLELPFGHFSAHPLWVADASVRATFGPKQTSLDG